MMSSRTVKSVITCAASIALVLIAQVAAAVELTSITTKKQPSGALIIKLHTDSEVKKPNSFTTTSPERLIIDLPATKLALTNSRVAINDAGVKDLLALATKTRSRIIINLAQRLPYHLEPHANGIDVVFSNEPAPVKSVANEQPAMLTTMAATPAVSKEKAPVTHIRSRYALKGIDFRRNSNTSAGMVIFQLSNPKMSVDIKRRGKKVLVKVVNAKLPSTIAHKLDVIDFATPVQFIDMKQVGADIEVQIESNGDFEHMVYQADRTLTIEVQPYTEEQRALKKQLSKEYTGQKLSLNFQDVDVRAVLQLIADFTKSNLVASDSVKGKLTLRLENVPWDQALDIILRSKGLGVRQVGNVMMVAPSNEIAAREKLELEASQQVSALAPLRSEFMQINFAKAADVAELLKNTENSLLSERGNVSIDIRTNTLLVQDTSDKLDEVREIIAQIDTPVRQVEIEARIVTARKNFTKNLGVRWGSSAQATIGNYRATAASNLTDSSDRSVGSDISTAVGDRLNVDFGVIGGSTLAFSVARLGQFPMLDLELSAAATEELTHVIASPKLITADQKLATIKQGRQIPYLEATSSGATSVSFKDATLELNVTPQITPDNHIIMDLNVKQDVVASSQDTFSSNTLPVINTKEIITQVLVDDGETVVLGGIYERTENNSHRKVPFFGDLPLVSALFKTTTDEDERDELLIFVTPRILADKII